MAAADAATATDAAAAAMFLKQSEEPCCTRWWRQQQQQQQHSRMFCREQSGVRLKVQTADAVPSKLRTTEIDTTEWPDSSKLQPSFTQILVCLTYQLAPRESFIIVTLLQIELDHWQFTQLTRCPRGLLTAAWLVSKHDHVIQIAH